MSGPGPGWDAKDQAERDAQQYANDPHDEDTSQKEVERVWHEARNDYQDVGSPYGELTDRSRDEK